MKRRWAALLLIICLLAAGMPAQATNDRFRTMEEVRDFLFYDCAYMLADEIEFAYMSTLDEYFSNGFRPWRLLYNCGMIDWEVSVDSKHRRVTITDIDYYPGFKIAQAWEIEMLHLLDADERTALAHAEQMVEDAKRYAQSPYQVLLNLHDALCERVTYTDSKSESEPDGWNYLDTAIGAFNYGKCECDGYADAFYLLATLMGWQVRLMNGDADNGSDDGPEAHTWNLLYWEGGWYHIDVTWDDLDWVKDASAAIYAYLLMGDSMISTHTWDEEHELAHAQPYANWDYWYYTADQSGVVYGAYYKTIEDAAAYAAWMQKNYDRRVINIMLDGDYGGQYEMINKALRKAGLSGTLYTWAYKCGDYTCIAVCIG